MQEEESAPDTEEEAQYAKDMAAWKETLERVDGKVYKFLDGLPSDIDEFLSDINEFLLETEESAQDGGDEGSENGYESSSTSGAGSTCPELCNIQ